MPNAPKRFNARPGQPQKRGWQSDKIRGNRHQRGYDTAWTKLRDAFVAEFPLCQVCEARGVVTEAQEVHHLQPFNGIDDPLRLDWDNLQSVCRRCHQQATGRRRRT